MQVLKEASWAAVVLPDCVRQLIADEPLCARFQSRYQSAGGGGGSAHFQRLCALVAGLFRAMVRFTHRGHQQESLLTRGPSRV